MWFHWTSTNNYADLKILNLLFKYWPLYSILKIILNFICWYFEIIPSRILTLNLTFIIITTSNLRYFLEHGQCTLSVEFVHVYLVCACNRANVLYIKPTENYKRKLDIAYTAGRCLVMYLWFLLVKLRNDSNYIVIKLEIFQAVIKLQHQVRLTEFIKGYNHWT